MTMVVDDVGRPKNFKEIAVVVGTNRIVMWDILILSLDPAYVSIRVCFYTHILHPRSTIIDEGDASWILGFRGKLDWFSL